MSIAPWNNRMWWLRHIMDQIREDRVPQLFMYRDVPTFILNPVDIEDIKDAWE